MSKSLMKILMILAVLILLVGGWLTPQPASAVALATGITATMDSNAKSGIPGSVVTYNLTLTNSEDVTLELTASTAGEWELPSIVPSTLSLTATESQTVSN